MKATGEVMSIDTSFESALLKAIRSLEIGVCGIRLPAYTQLTEEELRRRISHPDDERLFAIAEGFARGMQYSK